MPGQRVMEVSDEIVPVVLAQRHEGPAHHDELHLVNAVAELLQLVNAVFGLHVGVCDINDFLYISFIRKSL